MRRTLILYLSTAFLAVTMTGCPFIVPDGDNGDKPVAEGIFAPMGDPMPAATTDQLATFERGKAVFLKRFDLSDGLGPTFNVTFCGACHERPTIGGSAGLYRNFFIAGTLTDDGAFLLDDVGGILRVLHYGSDTARPAVPADRNVFGQRNPIPFYGAGLLAELSDQEIRSREDPDDADGDGISGRPNFDRGFVGRFGRKAQVVSIEGFIRGPLFNHLGITTDPLSEAQRAQLPVDSSLAANSLFAAIGLNQAAAPDGPTTDDDGIPDPELSTEDLFDLVSFAMLMAVPELEDPTEQSKSGRLLFDDAGCSDCHVPLLEGPRGLFPVYSDLLLHDMGEDLADGIEQGDASGSEFRTQPLVGLAAVGPYLHDGRAETLAEAILAHGGEAQSASDLFAALQPDDQADVVEFLLSLGGRSQFSTGLVPPDTSIPPVGEFGGPFRDLSAEETLQFLSGREVFDRDFGHATGVGALTGADGGPRFNGDSCRACHFDPVLGGAGPRGVNVMRHGFVDMDGLFSPPDTTPNTILHKEILVGFDPVEPEADINVFEHRQPPPAFGLGLIDGIEDGTIQANEDPDDLDGDGISGRAHVTPGGRVGRLGWKAQVPNSEEFIRDAMAAEIGLTLPEQAGLTFGITEDSDDVPDPELSIDEAEDLAFFLRMLAGPPRQLSATSDEAVQGEALFDDIGCTKCHIPSLPAMVEGEPMDVPLFSDLLLHEILPANSPGIEDGEAGMGEFRTAPLWGLSQTGPYFHNGEADTIDEAIGLHDGEAAPVRDTYINLTQEERDNLLAFLNSL